MQAVCDSECRFIAVTCKHVGSTNDIVAFNRSMLKDLCRQMSVPFHWVGDAAHMNSCGMIAPFEGTNLDLFKDSFNFFHSQIRITSERAFGILIQLWGILRKSLNLISALLRKLFTLVADCTTSASIEGFAQHDANPPAPEFQLTPQKTLDPHFYKNVQIGNVETLLIVLAIPSAT